MHLLDLGKCDLNAGRLSLLDTEGREPPPYAILSHRWQPEEVIFADLARNPKSKQGWTKSANTIQLARKQGFSYLWIDSCCIDKSSSAELSEAINSMWTWYREAAVCYVYLCDVSSEPPQSVASHPPESSDFRDELVKSVWFTRGWTLQELLAPSRLLFFNSTWVYLGDQNSLQDLVSEASGISAEVLGGEQKIHQTSIARRMSWASKRVTTRIEDTAYCLLGIFSVNMPLLHGEGRGAFIRLQEAILRNSDDYSIFAWKDEQQLNYRIGKLQTHGLLASSPMAFKDTGDTTPYQIQTAPCALTNKGLSISLETRTEEHGSIALLPCSPGRNRKTGFVGIRILKLLGSDGQYARVCTDSLWTVNKRGQPTPLLFPQAVPNLAMSNFKSTVASEYQFNLKLTRSDDPWNPEYDCVDAWVYFEAPLTRFDSEPGRRHESPWALEQRDQILKAFNPVSLVHGRPVRNEWQWQTFPIPVWSPGIALALLLRRSEVTYTKVSATEISSCFILVIGVSDVGQLWYSVKSCKSSCPHIEDEQRAHFEADGTTPTVFRYIGDDTDEATPPGPPDASARRKWAFPGLNPQPLDHPSQLSMAETKSVKTWGFPDRSRLVGYQNLSVTLNKDTLNNKGLCEFLIEHLEHKRFVTATGLHTPPPTPISRLGT